MRRAKGRPHRFTILAHSSGHCCWVRRFNFFIPCVLFLFGVAFVHGEGVWARGEKSVALMCGYVWVELEGGIWRCFYVLVRLCVWLSESNIYIYSESEMFWGEYSGMQKRFCDLEEYTIHYYTEERLPAYVLGIFLIWSMLQKFTKTN